MYIGLVIYGHLDILSGGYLYDRIMVEHLRQAGHAVEILPLPPGRYARHLALNLTPGLPLRLLKPPMDVMIQDELCHPSLALVNRRLRSRSAVHLVAIVHHLRSSEPHPPLLNRFYRWVETAYLRSVDAFVYNSRATRAAVERLVGAGRPHVIAYPAGDRLGAGPSDAQLERRALVPGPLRVLYLGNLIPRKGLLDLLDAFAGLPASDFRLAVVGDRELDRAYASRARRRARRLGLDDRVTWRGRLDGEALRRELAQAHVLALPSAYEGFGIAYLEGMAFGLPAVACRRGGPVEVIEDGRNGLLIAPGDVPALHQALLNLHHNRRRLVEMSLAARRGFEVHPAWADSAQQVEAFLHDLAAGQAVRQSVPDAVAHLPAPRAGGG